MEGLKIRTAWKGRERRKFGANRPKAEASMTDISIQHRLVNREGEGRQTCCISATYCASEAPNLLSPDYDAPATFPLSIPDRPFSCCVQAQALPSSATSSIGASDFESEL
eukprot:782149-Rhodomonas_salina.2